jgi:hypothetical protein
LTAKRFAWLTVKLLSLPFHAKLELASTLAFSPAARALFPLIVLFAPIIVELFPMILLSAPPMMVETLPDTVFSAPQRIVDLSPAVILLFLPPAMKLIIVVILLPTPPIIVDSWIFPDISFPLPQRIAEFWIVPLTVFLCSLLVTSEPLMTTVSTSAFISTCPSCFQDPSGLGTAKMILGIC